MNNFNTAASTLDIKLEPELKDIAAALCKAQAKMGGAVKDASNPFFKSKYADLESVCKACLGPLNDNGIAVTQLVNSDEAGNSYVVTKLIHTSGQSIENKMRLYLTKTDMQGLGSAISYARRYSLQAIVCMPAIDDDGEAATDRAVAAPSANTSPSIAKSEPSQDIKELFELGKKVFKGSKMNFAAWLGTNFQTNDPAKLTKEQISQAKNILTDIIISQE